MQIQALVILELLPSLLLGLTGLSLASPSKKAHSPLVPELTFLPFLSGSFLVPLSSWDEIAFKRLTPLRVSPMSTGSQAPTGRPLKAHTLQLAPSPYDTLIFPAKNPMAPSAPFRSSLVKLALHYTFLSLLAPKTQHNTSPWIQG